MARPHVQCWAESPLSRFSTARSVSENVFGPPTRHAEHGLHAAPSNLLGTLAWGVARVKRAPNPTCSRKEEPGGIPGQSREVDRRCRQRRLRTRLPWRG